MLSTSVQAVSEIPAEERDVMFRLYDSNYEGAIPAVFQQDLDNKDYVFSMRDDVGVVRGFSTLAVTDETFAGKPIKVLYSGDTIIEEAFWGRNQFAKDWLNFSGWLKSQAPDVPLYWLLIVKGHRTYRYLSLFIREYYPHYNVPTPSEFQELMHHLAYRRFATAYDSFSGLVKFPEPRSFLNEHLAGIPSKDSSRAEVLYFLQRNPQYYEGDELLCLCELKADNFTKFGQQWFEQGWR